MVLIIVCSRTKFVRLTNLFFYVPQIIVQPVSVRFLYFYNRIIKCTNVLSLCTIDALCPNQVEMTRILCEREEIFYKLGILLLFISNHHVCHNLSFNKLLRYEGSLFDHDLFIFY